MDAELNLAESDHVPEQWVKVRLVFVRGNAEATKANTGKHDWAVFLCSDPALTATEILTVYAMH